MSASSPTGSGNDIRTAKWSGGRDAEGLVETGHHVRAEAPGQRAAGQAGEVADPAQAETGQAGDRGGFEPERGHRETRDRRPGAARRGDPARQGVDPLRRRRGSAPRPVATLLGLRAGRGGFLLDGVAGAAGGGAAGEAGERPGRAEGVGDPAADRQAQVFAVHDRLFQKVFLASEEVGAAGQVDHQAVGRLLGDPGGELAGPAAQGGEEGGLGGQVAGAGDQGRADRGGVAQRHAGGQSRVSSLGGNA
jgi:hypothetical protein